MMYAQEIKELGTQLANTPVGERASLTYIPEEPVDAGDFTVLRAKRADTLQESARSARIVECSVWSGDHKRRLSEEQTSLLQQAYIGALGLKYFLLYQDMGGAQDDAWDPYGQILEELIWRGEEEEDLEVLRGIYSAAVAKVHAAVAAQRAAAL